MAKHSRKSTYYSTRPMLEDWQGDRVQIWSNPWLKDVNNPFFTTPFDARYSVLLAKDLVVNGMWNSELITVIFNNRDSGLILSLPLSGTDADDLFWLYEDKGFFSVKWAYKALTCGNQEPLNAEMAQVWQKFWKLKVSLQVSNFVWRASNNIMSLRDNLHLKKVDVLPWCPFCHQSMESLLHLLVTCSFTKRVW
ncbi:hypothetical protein K2173_020488 [Erythroxylum novogranatense]|uniref:Reverse transcriptase zinc-binding domain-containing protein n=1 Tax=Erythroxylum novogranatense TaxID=1862640 RepID=A0AAV8TGI8_9ROSI|nr:hypothetical protein K2173_020488 [Erythroxylum novogranatense]